MRHVSAAPPAFFRRGPSPLTRLAFFGLVSLVLLFADTRFRYLENLRHLVAVVLYPLQRVAEMPGDVLAYIGGYFRTQRSLSEENAVLQRRLADESVAVQGYASAQQEIKQLKALLSLRDRYGAAATAVEVLYVGRDPFTLKLFVDKGSDGGISPGEAVVDAEGVVGQVTRVFPYMAEVTLVGEKDHAVPVKVQRSGVRSVLFGAGAGRPPELRFTAPNADIEVGDMLVTSGIDGTYPPGLAVAQVLTMERDAGQVFARITAKPLAGVDHSKYLAVLRQATALPPRPDEPAPVEETRKGKAKSRRGG